MTKKDLIQNIKTGLKSLLKLSAQKEVGKLDNGTMLYTNGVDLGVGVEVMVMDQDENLAPIADGEYTFEDGTKMVIVTGAITEIGKAEEVVEDVIEDEVVAAVEEVIVEDAPDANEELKTRISTLEEEVKMLMDTVQKMLDNSNQMKKQIEKHLKEPAEEGIRMSKVEKKDDKNVNAEEAMENIRKRTKNTKTVDYSTFKVN